jgi:hypothetical protein
MHLFKLNTIVHYSEGSCYDLAYHLHQKLQGSQIYGLFCDDQCVHALVAYDGYYYDIYGKFHSLDDIITNWCFIYEHERMRYHFKPLQISDLSLDASDQDTESFVTRNLDAILHQPEFTADQSPYLKSIRGHIDVSELIRAVLSGGDIKNIVLNFPELQD